MTLIDGEPAELVDAHWLFANFATSSAKPAEQLVCRLPDDDPWMQNMLRPIVEAAGYRVDRRQRRGRGRRRHRLGRRRRRISSCADASASRRSRPGDGKDETFTATTAPRLLMALKSAERREALMTELAADRLDRRRAASPCPPRRSKASSSWKR